MLCLKIVGEYKNSCLNFPSTQGSCFYCFCLVWNSIETVMEKSEMLKTGTWLS